MSTRFFIKSLEVVTSQQRLSPPYEPNRREFVEGLNLLIGPPGSGKSTVIELIRFAWAQPGSRREGKRDT